MEELVPGRSVEEVVSGDQEDSGQVLVVVTHHQGLGGSLGNCQQGVHILDGSEGLLPQLQLDGHVEL